MGRRILKLEGVEVDLDQACVWRVGRRESLTPLENRLLGYLLAEAPRVIPREELLREVWQAQAGAGSDSVIRNVLKRLRSKIERDAGSPRHLVSVRGHGTQLRGAQRIDAPTAPPPEASPARVRLADRVIDLAALTVHTPDGDVALSPLELRLLEHLLRNGDQVVPRADLLMEVWGYRRGKGRGALVDKAVFGLRQKLEARPSEPAHLHAVRGIGYRWSGGVSETAPASVSLGPSAVVGLVSDSDWSAGAVWADATAHAGDVVPAGPGVTLVRFDDFDQARTWALRTAAQNPLAVGLAWGTDATRVGFGGTTSLQGAVAALALGLARGAAAGQVLTTEDVARQTRTADVIRVGPCALLGVMEPVSVVQVGLGDHGPMRVAPLRTGNLPQWADTWIVQDRAVRALDVWRHSPRRLCTVVGEGGAGKTRLVTEWAQRRMPQATFVDLTRTTTAHEAALTIARGLGVLIQGGDATEILAGAIAHRGATLLVLDNLEQVVAQAAPLVRRLLSAAPDLQILATSRIPLDHPAEQVVRLTALREAPAALLFHDRTHGRFEDDPLVDEVLELLGGLPLAIELAAARARALPLGALRDGLRSGYELLERNAASRDDHQRSLGASLAWSWSLLSEPERQALLRLTSFTGSFDFDAAVEVVGSSRAAGRVAALADASLVQTAEASRMRVLATVRWFVRDTVRADDWRSAIRRADEAHGAYCARLGAPEVLDQWGLTGQAERRARRAEAAPDLALATRRALDRGDIDTASRCALALAQAPAAFGPMDRAVALLSSVPPEDNPLGPRLLLAEAGLRLEAWMDGEAVQALAERARVAADALGDVALSRKARALWIEAAGLSRPSEAVALWTAFLPEIEDSGDPRPLGYALTNLHAAREATAKEPDHDVLDRALRAFRQAGDEEGACRVALHRLNEGLVFGEALDEGAEQAVFEQLYACNPYYALVAASQSSARSLFAGDLGRAQRSLALAEPLAVRFGGVWRMTVRRNYAILALLSADFPRAVHELDAANALAHGEFWKISVEAVRGVLETQRGEPTAACRVLESAWTRIRAAGAVSKAADTGQHLAWAQAAAGRLGDARQTLQATMASTNRDDLQPSLRARWTQTEAWIFACEGDWAAARCDLAQAQLECAPFQPGPMSLFALRTAEIEARLEDR